MEGEAKLPQAGDQTRCLLGAGFEPNIQQGQVRCCDATSDRCRTCTSSPSASTIPRTTPFSTGATGWHDGLYLWRD